MGLAACGKKVLNVGGNTKAIAIPSYFDGFEHIMLDIDPVAKPDILCDARALKTIEAGLFDAIYCSHNLEHYYRHDVFKVLEGFIHVMKEGGFAQIRVPNMQGVFKQMIEKDLDIDDELYKSVDGQSIKVLDVIYGWSAQIERSGVDFFAHKTGFTIKSLLTVLQKAGFGLIHYQADTLEINAYALKGKPNATTLASIGHILPT